MKKSLIVLALAAASSASIAKAQSASVLDAGTRVRLVTPALDATQQTGKVVSVSADTIVFRADANPVSRSFAINDLSSIEISAGKRTHRGRDALYGLAIGGSAGALAGALTYKKPAACYWFCDTRSSDAIIGGVAGGLVGTLVGAFIVGSMDKSERWIPVRSTTSIRFAPTAGGARVAMSVRF